MLMIYYHHSWNMLVDGATFSPSYNSAPSAIDAMTPNRESWNDECNAAAAFLDHRRVWLSVMTELLLRLTPSLEAAFLDHRRVWLSVMTELLLRLTPSLEAAFLDHRRVWLSVMTELLLRLTPSLEAAFLDHQRDWLGVMTELQRYPFKPSHDHMSPLQRRRRRTLAPLRLCCNMRRNMSPRHVRRNLLRAFNNDP